MGVQDGVVKFPPHYQDSYKFEVYEAINLLLDTYYKDASPSVCWSVGNELRYRFRAGLKEDGHAGAQDIAKAMRVRQMREQAVEGCDYSDCHKDCCTERTTEVKFCSTCNWWQREHTLCTLDKAHARTIDSCARWERRGE